MKSPDIFMVCALGIVALLGGTRLLSAGNTDIEKFLDIKGDEKKRSYLEQLTSEELLKLANEAGAQDPSGQYLDWILFYGLKQRWDQKPLAPEIHLSMVSSADLSAAWRTMLISALPRYSDAWSIQQIEAVIKEALNLLKRSEWSSTQKTRIAAALDRIIIRKITSIADDDQVALVQKKLLVDKLHLTAKLIISTLVESLRHQPDADDKLLRTYVIELHSFGQIYLTQEDTYRPEYREGTGFAQAVESAQAIRPAFKGILTSGKYPPDTVLEAVRSLRAMKFDADVPGNVVEINTDNPHFTPDKLEILSHEVKKVHPETGSQ